MDLIEAKHKNNINRHPWEFARFEVLKHYLKKQLVNTPNFTIVDIGCGDSFVVESISKIYPKATLIAVDTAFTPDLIEHYKQKVNNINISFYYNIDEVPKSIKADCILLMDVIEHIEYEIDFMKLVLAKQFVTQKTNWFITVPAFQNLFCQHDVFLGHYRRYDSELLKKATTLAGLETKEVGYFFFSLILPRYLQVKKEKINKNLDTTTGLVDYNGGMLTTLIIKTALIIDFKISLFFKLFGIKLLGLSNYIICKKQP